LQQRTPTRRSGGHDENLEAGTRATSKAATRPRRRRRDLEGGDATSKAATRSWFAISGS